MYLPQLPENSKQQIMTSIWYGYNHNLRIQQGESYDQYNMTNDNYPVLSTRRPHGESTHMMLHPRGLIAKEQLAYVNGTSLYYAGRKVDGITLTVDDYEPKQLVSMGSYLLVFPDGVYYNTLDVGDYGSINANYTSIGSIDYTLCDATYNDMTNVPVSDSEPTYPEGSGPQNGDYWINTGSTPASLMQYSSYSSSWTLVPTTFVKISSPGIGVNFNTGDGVSLGGCAYTGDNQRLANEIDALNGDILLHYVTDDYIVVTGMLSRPYQQTEGTVAVSRTAPDMDFVVESNNRLWGCKFGMYDGDLRNEIYSCKLGDFKNWRVYAGLSTDSYAVSVGSDGPFTGAITYKNLPHFFKEHCVYQIYGTMPSNYQVVHTKVPGVMASSPRSLVSEGGYLYYKSPMGVCRFDGSGATYISQPLGDVEYTEATAGAFHNKVYFSLHKKDGWWHLFCYDVEKNMWSHDDNIHVLFWASTEYDLFYLTDAKLGCINGTEYTLEGPFAWYVVSAPIGYEFAEQKYLTRFDIRMALGAGSTAVLEIQYDSSGEWIQQGDEMRAEVLRSFTVPVRPRRCDHIRWRLRGTGTVDLYSVAKQYESGSDVV